jgi:Brp/Blh family beta-carotene 15,15'-monooxygenase
MTRSIFVFIAALLFVTPLVSIAGVISLEDQMLVCLPLILFLGIPHGAIDHVLFKKNSSMAYGIFILRYLLVVGVTIGLWMVLPALAYALFLLLSAYHFGQSQFSHHQANPHRGFPVLQFAWGVSVLAALVLFNWSEVNATLNDYQEFNALRMVHAPVLNLSIFLSAFGVTLGLLYLMVHQRIMSLQDAMMEVLVLGLILAAFYLLPLLIGFTLFFVILHAVKVLHEEYQVLHDDGSVRTLSDFIRMVFPFTLFSIAGIGMLFLSIYAGLMHVSYGYGMLIAISAITVPHAFVMNRFYARLFNPLRMKRVL